jgi:uncharacterized membrane protein YeiH
MSRVQTLYELQMIGTAVFAVTGVLAVNRRGLDALGGTVLGTVTALGGGTIRDAIIRAPVFWLVDTNYLLVAVVASLVAFFTSRLFKTTYTLLLYLDALGAAMFAIQATDKVLALQFAPAIAVAMGVLTSIGGGLLRDVLAGRQTLLMSREIYATPILLGCLLYVALRNSPLASAPDLIISIAFIFCIRAAAIHWHIQMPGWLTNRHDQP